MIIRELLTQFGVRYDDKGAQKAQKSVGSLVKSAQGFAAAFAGSFVVRGLTGFVTNMVEAADKTAKTADKLGIATDVLQELDFAAQRSGVAVTAMRVGIQRFTRRAAEAAKGTGVAKDVLAQMGVTLKDVNGNLRPAEDLLNDVADAFQGVESDAERVRIAFKLFDTEGVNLVNMLRNGSEGLEQLREDARATGGIMAESFLRDAEASADEMLRFDFVMQGLRNTLGAVLIPGFTAGISKVSEWILTFRKFTKDTELVRAALMVLAGVSVVAAAQFLAPWAGTLLKVAAAAAVIAAITLIMEDLIVLFEGGESALGLLLDKFGGLGTAQVLVDSVRTGWQLMGEAVDSVGDSITSMGATLEAWGTQAGAVFDEFGSILRQLFGDEAVDMIKRWATELFKSIPLVRGIQSAIDFVSSGDFTEQRKRVRTKGPGMGAAAFKGPGFGRANAEKPGAGGGVTLNQGDTNVTVQGGADQAVADRLARRVEETIDRKNRDALSALKPVGAR